MTDAAAGTPPLAASSAAEQAATSSAEQPRFSLDSQQPQHSTALEQRLRVRLHTDRPLLCLSVLSAVAASQLANGLRHGDYHRYRQYCARRLRRLRAALGLTAQGKGAAGGRPRPLPSPLPSSLHLQLLLVQAERSWAYALAVAGERTDATPRKRFHQLKRLKRAVQQSALLSSACQLAADASTQLQAEAYAADLCGLYGFERGQFAAALRCFLQAQSVYSQLAAAAGSGELQRRCEERIDRQRDQIRMCQYFSRQSADGQAEREDERLLDLIAPAASSLSSKVQAMLAEREQQQAARLDTVSWLGRQIAVGNEKARLLLVRAARLEEQRRSRQQQQTAVLTGSDGSEATAASAAASEADGEGEGEGQQSLAGLHQQLANCYDDIARTVKDDMAEAVRQQRQRGGSSSKTPQQPLTAALPPSLLACLPACRSWSRTAQP